MTDVLISLIVLGGGVTLYAYVVYPLVLMGIGWIRPFPTRWEEPADWPVITVTICAYNEEQAIGGAIDHVLDLDYPADRLHLLVVSDGSTDGTDEIVRSYADRGVELLRLETRGGKTAAENAAWKTPSATESRHSGSQPRSKQSLAWGHLNADRSFLIDGQNAVMQFGDCWPAKIARPNAGSRH